MSIFIAIEAFDAFLPAGNRSHNLKSRPYLLTLGLVYNKVIRYSQV